MGTAELGAMTDASKRRFDPDEEAMMEDGFEMVSSNVYDPADMKVDIATMIAERPALSAAFLNGDTAEQTSGQKKWGRFLSMLSSEKG